MSANNTIPFHNRDITVIVDDDEVTFDGFRESDPLVVQVLRDADDPEAMARTALQVGARAIQVANATTDTNLVETRFEQMANRFDQSITTNITDLAKVTEGVFGDDGTVQAVIDKLRQQFEQALGENFDPDSKSSVIAKIGEAVGDLVDAQRRSLQRALDPTDEASPLRKIVRDMKEIVHDSNEQLSQQVRDLSERIAVEEKHAEVFNLTTAKGLAFEDLAYDALCVIAANYGDLAEPTGTTLGSAGTKKGDVVISLDTDDTAGREVRIAVEMKDKKLGHKAIREELDAAMDNRDAGAALMVFAKQDHAPTKLPFTHNGNHAVVVLDKDDVDANALTVAYMWARYMARRNAKATVDADTIDLDHVLALFDNVEEALASLKAIRTGHSQAKKGIDSASKHVTLMVERVQGCIDELRDELDG